MLFIPLFAFANIVINEIAWMGTAESSYCEWVELYNNGSGDIDLSGWGLYEIDSSGDVLIMALTKSLAAGGYYLIERITNSCPDPISGTAADDAGSFGGSGLSNSGEKLGLKNAAGAIVESIDASGGWLAGNNTTEETMQKSGSEWITAAATPRAANAGAVSPSEDSGGAQQESSSASASAGSSASLKKFFTVDAGGDIKTVAGAEVRFSGAAYGESGALLSSTSSGHVRYLWNFGDGAFFEGKNTNHIYRYPGTYRAALYVSSGETSGSDVVEVRVEESKVMIGEMAHSWIELVNGGNAAIDVSSWEIRSDTGAYRIPVHTIIGAGAFVVFSQEVSGLLFGPINPQAELRYANGTRADSLLFVGTLLEGQSIIRDEKGKGVTSISTPGKPNKIFSAAQVLSGQNTQEVKIQNSKIAYANSNDKVQNNEKLNPIPYTLNPTLPQQASLFSSNYFWLAVSVSVALLAGAVVLALRAMVLF